jgi:Ribonuclease H2 non-catalytic subunit (Ylr154p-like)
MVTKTILSIPNTPADVPLVSPNLMPFHIAYSGPAPISTYFLKRPFADPETENQTLATSKSLKNTKKDGPEEECNALAEKENHEIRLRAAFRGRQVVSQTVQLPKGYTGLLLRQHTSNTKEESFDQDVGSRNEPKKDGKSVDAKAKATARAKALKAKAAAKLKKERSRHAEDEDEEENAEDEDPEEMHTANTVDASTTKQEERVFQIAGRFDKFQLWHPDVPGDQGRDEYARALNEWITLTAEARLSCLRVS